MKTAEEFEAVMGRPPEGDDMERVNCEKYGNLMHSSCGWCDECNHPMFDCRCSLEVREQRRKSKIEPTTN